MKKIHILGIIIIAVAIGIIMTTASDASTYVDFSVAEKLAKEGNNDKVHVVGKLKKDASGTIVGMYYNPAENPNYFEFMLVDTLRNERKVVLSQPKPQDMDKSEQVVIIGKMEGNIFRCDKVLLKCPSKYQEGTPKELGSVK